MKNLLLACSIIFIDSVDVLHKVFIAIFHYLALDTCLVFLLALTVASVVYLIGDPSPEFTHPQTVRAM